MNAAKETINYYCDDIIKDGYLGQGITAAVLDTGISLHPDFDSRIVAFRDFVDHREEVYDDSGHGTHVAGILGGSGKMSDGRYAGMAPNVKLVIAKVLDKDGNGNVDAVVNGIDWILKLIQTQDIHIVNISVGTHPGLERKEEERLIQSVEKLWDAGVTVVVSSGNYGPKERTVAAPGSSRKVITVGAVNLPERNGVGKRRWDYSGRGPTENCVVKPDLVAPGTYITSCNGAYINKWKQPYTEKSGTSMATPIVSGAVACVLSKYPDMSNVEVKLRLRESCVPYNSSVGGWGILNMKWFMEGKQ